MSGGTRTCQAWRGRDVARTWRVDQSSVTCGRARAAHARRIGVIRGYIGVICAIYGLGARDTTDRASTRR